MYIYWQQDAGQNAWHPALAQDRDLVVQKHQPRLTTVLSVNRIAADVPSEEIINLKYSGPFYADFDATDLAVSIRQTNKYLDKLAEAGVDLDSVGLFATGNRGFHVEVPMGTFHAKPPKDGIVQLPAIYKEMAYSLYVDNLDMRVYTAKSGRMWRVTNIQRENGAYKVPVTAAELRAMTPEIYTELCKAPRPYGTAVPNLKPPAFSPELATLFASSEQKVGDALKRRKTSKIDQRLLEKHGGKVPPSIEALMAGVDIREGAGWNAIAMQIAITMNALGRSEDEIVEQSRRAIETHQGDSNRYGTPALREEQLRAQIAYTAENPCYSFSVGAVKAVLAAGVATPDLEGITDETQAKAHVEAQELLRDEDGGKPLHVGNIVVTTEGIFQKTEDGQKAISAVGFTKVRAMTLATEDGPGGFDVVLIYRGKRRQTIVPFDVLQSRSKLNSFFSAKVGGTFSGSDIQAGFVQEWLGIMAHKNNQADGSSDDMLIRREGLDMIQLPATMDVPEVARKPFPVFGSPEGCVTTDEITAAGLRFRYMGDPTPAGHHKSDIALAPELVNDERTVTTLRALFNMNRERNIAACLGWFIAAHARMYYHRHRKTFPLLAISGQAGSGKSHTTRALMHLHFYKQEALQVQCPGATIYAITTAIQASASLPVWLDEYKPRDLGPVKSGQLKAILRACYDNGSFIKGGANQSVMSNGRELMQSSYSGPTIFLGEATEMESAILERSVIVLFDKTGVHGRAQHLRTVQDNADVLSAVGRRVLLALLAMPFPDFCASFDKDHALVSEVLLDRDNFRLTYNYAVTHHGLTMLDAVLKSAGINLSEEINEMKQTLLQVPSATGTATTRVRAEASKVLSVFSQLSKTIDRDTYYLLEGQHFAYSDAGGIPAIEICLPFAFAKYELWQSQRHRQPLYDSEEQFLVAMRNYSAFVDESPQVLTSAPHVMRFNLDILLAEGVEPFQRRG